MKNIVILLLILPIYLSAQDVEVIEKWGFLNALIGKWEGQGEGRWGASKVFREYVYLMGGTYIIGKNKSTYDKQERNPEGEIHDNWDIFSYDKNRAKYVLRQFHAEDITNTYALDSLKSEKGLYEFESENIENFSEGWNAKEVYHFLSNDEFVEIFYLAAPGKEYQEYVRNTFRRIK